MTTPKYFKLPVDGLPVKKNYPAFTGMNSDNIYARQAQGFNECRDEAAQKHWFLCEGEMESVIDEARKLWAHTSQDLGEKEFVIKALAAAGSRILKFRKDDPNAKQN